MITRMTEDGETVGPEQAVTLMDALRCYTINGAYAGFDEDKLGSVEVGKLADLVVLSGDILGTPVEEIPGLMVDVTVVDGVIVYRRA